MPGLVTLAAAILASAPFPTPNPIHQYSSAITTVLNTTANGKLLQLSTTDGVSMKVLHTWGSSEEQGRAEGELLGGFAAEFLEEKIPQFLTDTIKGLDLSKLPDWLRKALEGKVGLDLAEAALGAVYLREHAQIKTARSGVVDQIKGMADGLCASGAIPRCSSARLAQQISNLNMFSELVKMTCSMFGAWGSATPKGGLVQLRTLDFGGGPWANYSVVHVYHPTEGNPFVSLGFPAFVGAVTGFSTKVAISEKVWETYTDPNGVQPGTFGGFPDAFALREILQFANSRGDAIAIAEGLKRNWAMFVGVGDAESQQFNALGYREKDLLVFSPDNITNVTHMPVLADTVYIDKHPQPSHDQTTMPALLTKYHGQITGELTASNIPRFMQSGDVHIGVYDFGKRSVLFSTGKVDTAGNYLNATGMREGLACNQPYVEFGMDDLLQQQPPSGHP